MKKIKTKVTDVNDGMHSPREFQKAKRMLETCKYVSPRLYHLCFTDSNQPGDFQEARKSLCEELRRHGAPCQWRACLEADDNRGFHMHIFILVEAKYFNPDHIINRKEGGWLRTLVLKRGIDFHLNPPRDRMHWTTDGKQPNYAYVPKKNPEKLANCIEWISYLYKARSKAGLSQIYSSSRPTREIPKA